MDSLSTLTVSTKIYGLLGLLCIFAVAVSGSLIWSSNDKSASVRLASKTGSVVEQVRICGDLQNWSCSVKE
jgi:hypothetical protein